MNSNKKKSENIASLYVVQAGLVAALYFCLNLVSSVMGLAFGPLQIRLSEMLCLLPIIYPSSVPGLAIGCALSNISSPYGLVDVIIGSIATLFAAMLVRKLKSKPIIAALMPVIINAIAIGAEMTFLTPTDKTKVIAFLIFAGQIAISEVIPCAISYYLVCHRLMHTRR